jgi:hypothetical protein
MVERAEILKIKRESTLYIADVDLKSANKKTTTKSIKQKKRPRSAN